MKKLLCVLAIMAAATIAQADCTVTVSWVQSPDAAAQELIYFDGTNEVVKSSGDMTLNTAQFSIVTPLPADEVFIRSYDASGTDYTDSVRVPVGGVSGATSISVTTVCQ
jgi:hypothetical protein